MKPRTVGVGLVLASVLSVHSGAAVAATLFPYAGIWSVVAIRLTVGAVLLLAWCRPALRGRSGRDWAVIGAFGLALAGMNTVFYEAIERIPLGPAVTVEVLGPLTLSVVAARRRSAWLWAGLALAGVLLLGHGGFDRLDPVGVVLALAAGVFWASYIVLSSRAGARFPKADGLALAMGVAALLSLPLGIAGAGPGLLEPRVLLLGSAVAVLSSVLPYSLELVALRRLPTATFAVLMSLGPAIAACAGWAILGQALSWSEAGAIVLVVAASIGAVRSAGPRNEDLPGTPGARSRVLDPLP
ncbi:EamA family transporter [Actinoplanes sp. NBRC 103695]|uniref:EamA family transporter n=1 Tax=Actinoplanes sp. NBRC 103695 TaxID=3032202 RepID=UPI0024A14436|nr:EamA family transporter [Actinoplanes sp. NBRC 103695]GLY93029.1 membrane protein [Actinoplanes sp. NBRC 103695]